MNSFGKTKSAINPGRILGGIPGLPDEFGFERESSVNIVRSISESTISLIRDIAGTEGKSESKTGNFPTTGTLNFKEQNRIEQLQKQQEEQQKEQTRINERKSFFQALKEDIERAQRAKDKLLFEEEMDDIVTNLPTEQKNRLLHYQAGYKDRSIYQRAELRKKIIEEQKRADKQEKTASIPSPARKSHAMQTAFEGGSGTQGSGTANLSNMAVG